jgi:DNA-binding NarL/FixJ family response regulator
MSPPIRVLIVDDHAVVREGIRNVLLADPSFAVVAEASNADDAVRRAAETSPDVVLLDITMPGRPGFDAVQEILAASPRSRVLMLTVHDDNEYVLRSVRAGAHGYLQKDTTPGDLRAAVQAVHTGGGFFSPRAAGHLSAALRGEAPAPETEASRGVESLTARERQVLALITEGLINKEIAAQLAISVRTVEAHRDNLARKLGVRSAAALTRLAVAAGLIGPNPPNRPA